MEKKTLYEITDDTKKIYELYKEAVDENGNPRELYENEENIIGEWFAVNRNELETKANSIGKVYKNLRFQAEAIKAEAEVIKKEYDSLMTKAKTQENHAEHLKNYLWSNLDFIGLAYKGIKTELFSFKAQATAGAVNTLAGLYDYKNIPEKFLKEPELDKTAIKEALKDGSLFQKDEKEFPLLRGKLYFMQDGKEQELKGVSFLKGTTFVIR